LHSLTHVVTYKTPLGLHINTRIYFVLPSSSSLSSTTKQNNHQATFTHLDIDNFIVVVNYHLVSVNLILT
jgi:hypothetical protein